MGVSVSEVGEPFTHENRVLLSHHKVIEVRKVFNQVSYIKTKNSEENGS